MIGRRLLEAADTHHDAAQGRKDLREPLLLCDLLHGSLLARSSPGNAKKARGKSALPLALEQCALQLRVMPASICADASHACFHEAGVELAVTLI